MFLFVEMNGNLSSGFFVDIADLSLGLQRGQTV